MPLRALADGRLFAHVFGSGPPQVLALHGWGRTGSDFAAVLTRRSGLAPDLPGFGASPEPASVWGAADYAQGLRPVLAEFDEPPVVVGHSFGGRVAVCLAADRPGSVSGLVLTGVPLIRRTAAARPGIGYRLVRGLHRRGFVPDRTMEALRRRRGSTDYRAAEGLMRDVLVKVVNESYEDRLAALDVPVEMVWGAADSEAPVAVAHRALQVMHSAGVEAALEIVDGAGHFLPGVAPDRLRAAIDRITGR